MEDFAITSRMSKKEYVNVMFRGLYQKPSFILATLYGLFMAATVILDHLESIEYYTYRPIWEIICIIILLSAPALIVLISVRQFTLNPNFQHDISYTFGDGGVSAQSLTCKSEFMWSHIIKQKEIGKFLILYHTQKAGNFIDKTKLTAEQLEYIKSKIIKK
jgi:hypothetical protein